MGTPEIAVASAASVLRFHERVDLGVLAAALPEGWCAVVEPPYGQLCITPIAGYRFPRFCWAASRDGRVDRLLYGR